WLVDALKATGYTGPLESVFARGQMVFGAAMLLGTLSGGALGQMNLALPYLVRAGVVVPLFALVWFAMREVGYTPRTLELARVPAEMRRVFVEGLRYGVHHPVVRPVLLGSLVTMTFMIFGYYSWQRYFLDLLGRDAVWVAMPGKAGYLNAHIPSEQRATILSLDSFFANLGGVAGQTGWGWLAKRRSIAEAWVASGATLVLGVPLYWIARRADGRLDRFEATSP